MYLYSIAQLMGEQHFACDHHQQTRLALYMTTGRS
jgi:hypothetical protein